MLTLINITIFCQIIILELQKYAGSKIIIPAKYRILPYNYFITQNELDNSNNVPSDCAICMDILNLKQNETYVSKDNTSTLSKDKENNLSESNEISIDEHSRKNSMNLVSEINESTNSIKDSELKNQKDEKDQKDLHMTLDNALYKRILIYLNHKYKNLVNRFKNSSVKTKLKMIEWLESLKFQHKKTSYMKTPCNHIFHTECFKLWIDRKNECPMCRTKIPPLE
jgi:hypothetical protein